MFPVLGMMCIVKPDGPPQLCKTDEIGEICVSSRTGGMMYYGLSGVTKNTFEVCNGTVILSFRWINSGFIIGLFLCWRCCGRGGNENLVLLLKLQKCEMG